MERHILHDCVRSEYLKERGLLGDRGKALGVLAALAGVGLSANPVHRYRKGSMDLGRNRAH